MKEVPHYRMTVIGQHRLRVELHALDRMGAVADSHDLAIVPGPRRDHEAVGQVVIPHHQ